MSSFIQNFLLKNTKWLQNLVNNKLARKGPLPNFWKWMEIGPRSYGEHILPKYFRAFNTMILVYGLRFQWHRPQLTKYLFSKEREIYIIGYAGLLYVFFLFQKRNKVTPAYMHNDSFLNDYDSMENFKKTFANYIPHHVHAYKKSAHYLEINKIFSKEMASHYEEYKQEVENEFYSSSEKIRRTKYLGNPNYVYEPFGWENEERA